MKKSFITFALISGIISCSFLVSNCSNKAKQEQAEEHDAVKNDSTQIAYACPMHPEVTGKEGDKCSKCNMKLEAVKKTDSAAAEHHH